MKKQRLELGKMTLLSHGGSIMLGSVSREDYDRVGRAMGTGEQVVVTSYMISSGIFGKRLSPRPVTLNLSKYHTLKPFEPHGTYAVRLP